MTEQEIRAIIIDALEYANVVAISDQNMATLFLEGREDIEIQKLNMDSLATMELCIALEVNTGVSIVPDDLQKIATLDLLVKAVQERDR